MNKPLTRVAADISPLHLNSSKSCSQSLGVFTAVAILLSIVNLSAEAATLTVHADAPGAKINPAMWGIFFEDINLGADGGLYAELVKNRSFEFPNATMGWSKVGGGKMEIRSDSPFDPANPHYLHVESEGSTTTIANEGFRGMGLHGDETYDFSAQVRAGSIAPVIRIELVNADGTVLDSARLKKTSGKWQKLSATLKPKSTAAKAHLNLIVENGNADFDMVSLFPRHTWRNRSGGLRADMVQMLADLKPGFLRFPGGCIVEGSELDRRYQWKTTIGPIEDRKLIINRWNYEFKHRLTPDYFQSFGLGFFEFFQLCEDIGAEPLPILNCGMACQFNTGQLVPLDQIDPYVQDALDLIEFANGPVTSTWGAKRAAMGHPKPFNLKMLGVGNEQWGQQYFDRYPTFAKAIKAKYPEIQLVSSAGPSPADDRFNFAWPKLRELHADIVDEHCYANPIWFFANSHRYDNYDRNGPKIFMGEYAAQSIAIVSPDNKNNLECALSEAAYMTGLERNADVVRMASYAPLFAHIDGWQWTPNLIWADNLRVYGTPNYYVQQLFSRNRGDVVLPVELNTETSMKELSGGIALGTYQTAAEFKDVNVTANGSTLFSSDLATNADGWKADAGKWGVKDGAYQQSDAVANNASVSAGDASWNNYTVSLRARKLSGKEGFIITVLNGGPENRVFWNLGGFGNTANTLDFQFAQQDHQLSRVSGSIEIGRWYDVKMEIQGNHVNCYLDGQLVQSSDVPLIKTQSVYASAARDNKAGEIILKVVNPGAVAEATKINLAGVSKLKGKARAWVLAGSNGDAVNSFDQPDRVKPAESAIKIAGPAFDYTCPPRSLTVLRVPVR